METEQTRLELLDELKAETGDKLRRLADLRRQAQERVKQAQERVDRIELAIIDFEYLRKYLRSLYRPQYQPSAIGTDEIDNMLEHVDELIEEPGDVPASMFRQLRLVLLRLKAEILEQDLAH